MLTIRMQEELRRFAQQHGADELLVEDEDDGEDSPSLAFAAICVVATFALLCVAAYRVIGWWMA